MRRTIASLLAALALCGIAQAQSDAPPQTSSDERLKQLEARLDQALKLIETTQSQVRSLTDEVRRLKAELSRRQPAAELSENTKGSPPTVAQEIRPPAPESEQMAFTERVLGTDIGESERGHRLSQRPEIFIQTRFSTLPHEGASIEDIKSNFRLSRIETRWSGRVNERFGLGLEIQYHPAPDGSPEELVNDAFIEYYLSEHATVRVGQFVKPFGFDIQQSSSVRESAERAIFAGYFFPGQRDRGVLLFGDLDFLKNPALKNIQYFAGALNGNRFFTDSNRQMNYLFRLRKRFDSIDLAAGVSAQFGNQSLPPGVSGNNDENVFGVDLQYVRGRFGVRGEFAAGNMPSTLLGPEPEFAPAYRPGRHSSGGALFATYRLAARDNLYARYDRFNGDPVTGLNVRAFNLGYFRFLGEAARIGFDYQFKDRLSFNDDAINTRLQVTFSVTAK